VCARRAGREHGRQRCGAAALGVGTLQMHWWVQELFWAHDNGHADVRAVGCPSVYGSGGAETRRPPGWPCPPLRLCVCAFVRARARSSRWGWAGLA
jgi:hypothetical protein